MRLRLSTAAFCLLLSTACFGGNLKIVHIDVGQGDATLIIGPEETDGNRVAVLIDAGDIPSREPQKKDGGERVLAVLKRNQIEELDFFVATHYHADHIGGMVSGTKRYGQSVAYGPNGVPGDLGDDDGDGKEEWYKVEDKVEYPDRDELGKGDDIAIGMFVDRGDTLINKDSKTTLKYLALANARKNRQRIETLDDVENCKIDLGDGAKMTCLSANGWVRGRIEIVENVTTENEHSICFLVSYGGFDYLIGGDISGRKYRSEDAKVEVAIGKYLESEGTNIDVLQVNHHGSGNTSAADFLALIKPEVALITAGNGNEYKHPNLYALERLADSEVKRIYLVAFGNTMWNDIALKKKPKKRTAKERRHVARINKIRSLCTVGQGDLVLETDGQRYTIYCPSVEFSVDE